MEWIKSGSGIDLMRYFGNVQFMQRIDENSNAWLANVVAAVTTWEDWKGLASGFIPEGCDWLELRLDMMPEEKCFSDLSKIKPALPLLVTMRCVDEGGHRGCSDEERMALLEEWLPVASAIDVEIASMSAATALIASAKEKGVCVIASAHDFGKTPSPDELIALEAKARAQGADIVKFAFKLRSHDDLQTGCELLAKRSGKMAVMGMGDLGPVSRLLYAQLGSCLVYGSYGEVPSAPGQWPAGEFRRALSLLCPVTA